MADLEEMEPLFGTRNSGRATCKRRSMLCLSLAVFLERFVFYCISLSLPILAESYMQNETRETLVTFTLVFYGTCYFFPVFGGILGDAITGQTSAVIIGDILYFIGTLFPMYVFICDDLGSFKYESKKTLLCIGLFFIASGAAIFNANISALFAHQTSSFYGDHHHVVKKTFAWFYFISAFGTLCSAFMVAVPRKFNLKVLSIAACISMLLSLIIFALGTTYYAPWEKDTGKVKKQLLGIFRLLKSKCLSMRQQNTSPECDVLHSTIETNSQLSKETAQQLGRFIPIFGIIILFWMGYSQLPTSFVAQVQMVPPIFNTTNFWDVTLKFYDSASLLVLVPFIYLVIYPLHAKFCRELTSITRMGIGFIFMITSLATAGALEICRKQQVFVNTQGWYVVPQVILIAVAEVFTSITALEFACTESTNGLEGTYFGIYFCTRGIASYLSNLVQALVNSNSDDKWYAEPIDHAAHSDWYFFLLTGIVGIGFLIYIFAAWKYRYVHSRHTDRNLSDLETQNSV